MFDIRETVKERDARYGTFPVQATGAQGIRGWLVAGRSWDRLTVVQRESLTQLAAKLSRIVNGDPAYLDSWIDAIGYLQLAVDSMTTAPSPDASVTGTISAYPRDPRDLPPHFVAPTSATEILTTYSGDSVHGR